MNITETFQYTEDEGIHVQYIEIEYDAPESCMMCNTKLVPIKTGYSIYRSTRYPHMKRLLITYNCNKCDKATMYEYSICPNSRLDSGESNYLGVLRNSGPKLPKQRNFEDIIQEISPKFVEIYNQSLASETYDLTELSGMGYRKAFEFLIKDYLIYLDPEKEDSIKKDPSLQNCISNYPQIDSMVQRIAKPTAWLGNDFAHYTKKYTDSGLSDLKRCIDATVYMICMHITTETTKETLEQELSK